MSEPAALVELVERLSNARVLCVGDIMLDRFVYGSVERISPEAPIPVLQVGQETNMLGGVGNVVRNIAALGAGPELCTIAGEDTAGNDIVRMIGEDGISGAGLIRTKTRPTGIKTRYLAGSQQLMRADREDVSPIDAVCARKILAAAKKAMKRCGAVVLSDYGKGVLSPDLISGIIEAAQAADIPLIVDPKGQDYSRYRGATIITPNRAELALASGRRLETENDIVDAARAMVKKLRLRAILVTRSQDGMTLVEKNGTVSHLPAEAREVFDVSGAGDTVAAGMAAALAVGADLHDSAALANTAAGIVVGKVGTAAAYADDVIAALHHQDISDAEAKILSLDQALERIAQWRRAKRKVGFTNGCFDLLHPGHISLLSQARSSCGRLIVGLNSDASVKRLKGDSRPVQNEAARATVLASLSMVDAVVLFSDDTPIELIKAMKPDVLVKGADYSVDQVVGADVVKKYGGKIKLAKLEQGHSTTRTIERLGK